LKLFVELFPDEYNFDITSCVD